MKVQLLNNFQVKIGLFSSLFMLMCNVGLIGLFLSDFKCFFFVEGGNELRTFRDKGLIVYFIMREACSKGIDNY